MELLLKRKEFTASTTIGELWIDGKFECFTLEDKYRPPTEAKVPKKTAIPCNVYDVTINFSARFKRMMPLILNVLNFTGVRFHPGNCAEDTDGCILVGNVKHQNMIYESAKAFTALFAKLAAALVRCEPIRLTIVNEPVPKSDVKGAEPIA